MKYLVSAAVLCAVLLTYTGAPSAQTMDCREGTFYLGNLTCATKTRLTGYCIDWNTRMFTGFAAGGRSFTKHLEELETLTDSKGQLVNLAPPQRTTEESSPDSLYEVLRHKPLNEMTDREYEYFMLKKKAEIEKGSETTTAKAAMMSAEATKSMVNTYTVVAIIGIALSVILVLAAL